jgi:hypothetical protein
VLSIDQRWIVPASSRPVYNAALHEASGMTRPSGGGCSMKGSRDASGKLRMASHSRSRVSRRLRQKLSLSIVPFLP